jgi:hypothetical protein
MTNMLLSDLQITKDEHGYDVIMWDSTAGGTKNWDGGMKAKAPPPKVGTYPNTLQPTLCLHLLVKEMTAEREELASKLPDPTKVSDRFFLRSAPGQTNIQNSTMGENTIASLLPALCERADVTRYTNHSLRATLITKATAANIRDEDIAAVTGHRSVEGLNMYKHPSSSHARDVQGRFQTAMLPATVPVPSSNPLNHACNETIEVFGVPNKNAQVSQQTHPLQHTPVLSQSNFVSQGNFLNVHNTVAANSAKGGAIQSVEADLKMQREITSNNAGCDNINKILEAASFARLASRGQYYRPSWALSAESHGLVL